MIPEYQRDHYRKLFGMEPEEFFRLAENGQIVPVNGTLRNPQIEDHESDLWRLGPMKEFNHVERGHS